jgi:carbamoyltransferase
MRALHTTRGETSGHNLPIVIGFTFPPYHDNAVGVIVDGKLAFAAEEGRYTRHKHSVDETPFNSLVEALRFLRKLGIRPEDVDAFATNWDPKLYVARARIQHLLYSEERARKAVDEDVLSGGFAAYLGHLLKLAYHRFSFAQSAKHFLTRAYRRIGVTLPDDIRVFPVEHHLAHAASAYYFSGFSSSTVLTIDGRGERDSTVVWLVRNGEFQKIASVSVEDGSVGALYELVSKRLNFDRLTGPGKVMGLAPYGRFDELLSSKFQGIAHFDGIDAPYFFSDEFRTVSRGSSQRSRMYKHIADFLVEGLDLDWNPRTEPTKSAANLAWHLQYFTENVVEVTAKWAKQQTKENNLALAGGVALNAKANMRLHYARIYDDIFVFPAANDAGTAIGAAAYVHEHIVGEEMRHGRLGDIYLGPSYDDTLVKDIVKKGKWKAEYVGDNLSEVADRISKGHIVGWYQGRAELGPRALGNRSIIADPTRSDTLRRVNEIKGREYWRPLAPSVLDEDMHTYFDEPVEDRFMVLMFKMRPEASKKTPAICHVDMTSRPQSVVRESNPSWYDLIKAFKDNSGEGLIVNTSFNLAGEPLVETPQEAVKSFALGGFDDLYLQGWLIHKSS